MSDIAITPPNGAKTFETAQPSKLTEQKPDFAVKDRFTAHMFKQLGWNESLDFGVVGLDQFADLLSKSTAMASISQALESIKPVYQVFAKSGHNQDALEKTKAQFSGYFFDELKKRIGVEIPKTMKQQFNVQGKGKNIDEDLNPLEILQGYLEGTISEFVKNALGDSIEEKQAAIRSRAVEIFQIIWDINEQLRITLKDNRAAVDRIRSESIQNNRLFDRTLSKILDSLITIDSDDRFGTRMPLITQAIILKDQIRLAQDEYRKMQYAENVDWLGSLISGLDIVADKIVTDLVNTRRSDLEAIEANFVKISSKRWARSDVGKVDYYINEFFLINDSDKEITKSKFYNQVRNSFKLGGYSSVNPAATDFIKKTKTRSDVIHEVDSTVPTNHVVAQPKAGAQVDTIKEDLAKVDTPVTEKPLAAVNIGPLSGDAVTALLDCISDGKSYSFVSPNGFLGKWAFSPSALIEEQLLKPGTSGRGTITDSNWTGKSFGDVPGSTSRDDFLANTKMQDFLINLRTRTIYTHLLQTGILTLETPINEAGAAIATTYNFGLDVFKKLEKGGDIQDGLRRSAKEFYEKVKGQIPNELPSNDITNAVTKLGGTETDAIAALASASTPASTPTMTIPVHAGATQYPYNSVTETESGHFTEFDNTPGAERINERHRTGSGYEITADGSRKVVVVGNGYRAVLGDDFIMISGSCNISVFGDANISSKGDVNINAGNDINLVAGGNLHFDVAGELISRVGGNHLTNVDGNKIENVSGFVSNNADGDVQTEGASVASIAKDGIVTIAATQKVNVSSGEGVSVASPGVVTLTSNDTVGMFAKNAVVYGDISVSIQGSLFGIKGDIMTIKTESPIDALVKWSEKSGGLGPSTPVADLSGNPTSDDTSAVQDTEFATNIAKMETIDTSSTQAFGRGSAPVIRYAGS